MNTLTRYLIHNCQVCGGAFRTARYDSKFCSNKCRQKHYRKQKKLAGQGSKLSTEAVTLSYLEYLLTEHKPATMRVEDWQNS